MAGWFRCLPYAIASVFVVACSSNTTVTPGPRATASPTASPTPAPASPSPAPSVTSSPTPSHSSTPTPAPTPTATASAPPVQTVYWTLFYGDGSGTLEPHQVEYANTPLTAGSTYTDVSGTNANVLRCTNAMAVDGSGHIWILAAQSSCSRPYTSVLDEFAPPITPQSTPIATYTLSPPGLADAMTFDSSGDLFVGDVYNNQVLEYAGPLTGGGTLSPALTLSSGLNQPNGVAVDTHGNLFVSNGKSTGTSSIAVFHTPVSTMTTPTFLSGLTNPGGLILDSAGNLYGSTTP